MRVFFRDKVIDFPQNPQPEDVNWDGIDLEHLEQTSERRIVAAENFERFAERFIPVEAAGGVVRSSSGRVLMILRRGVWDLPKGHREAGETMRQCALREVVEECGIAGLTLKSELCTTYHIYKAAAGHREMKRTVWYVMSVEGQPAPRPQTEEEIVETRWMTPAECLAAIEDSYATIKYVIGEYYG